VSGWVNLDVQRGEVMVLLEVAAPARARCFATVIGLERPDSGTVLVQGVDINRCTGPGAESHQARMGVAFQEGAPFQFHVRRENIELPLRELTTLADPVIEIMTFIKLASVV